MTSSNFTVPPHCHNTDTSRQDRHQDLYSPSLTPENPPSPPRDSTSAYGHVIPKILATFPSSSTHSKIHDGFDFEFSSSEFQPSTAHPVDPEVNNNDDYTNDNVNNKNDSDSNRALESFGDHVQNPQQSQPQPGSGRNIPVGPPPKIQLTDTTPSPETSRKKVKPRSRSIQGLEEAKFGGTSGDESNANTRVPSDRQAQVQTQTQLQPEIQQHRRVVSTGAQPVSQVATKGKVRKSFFGGRSRSDSHEIPRVHPAAAWVVSDESGADYNTHFLTTCDIVPELWNESGNVLVHLYPRESGRGPSFKVSTSVISSSTVFAHQMREQLSADLPATQEHPIEYYVYVPYDNDNEKSSSSEIGLSKLQPLERLVAVRNLFAFLTGQALVATRARPTQFSVFLGIADLLSALGFSSLDGETFGDIPAVSFSWFMGQTGIADVRHSREKTLEALVLGERMRCKELYHEAFAHAAGKYAALQATRSPLLDLVSAKTRRMLERSHLDLVNRQHTLNTKIEQFDFPALFAGVASSNSAGREVNFARWKTAFARMRTFVLAHYRSCVGSWPPKGSSKKNNFVESGLNRQVLKMLYSDLCALYDLLVDRSSLSPRIGLEPPESLDRDFDAVSAAATDTLINLNPENLEDACASKTRDTANLYYLRKILDEYDTSTPPVVPPIPFDVPLVPRMSTVYENYGFMSAKDQQAFDRRIPQHELRLVLSKAYNIDTHMLKLRFLEEFEEFEAKECRGLAGGKSLAEIVDQRIGYWLFLYSVIQALPMLVVDAPDVHYTDGVEYFLCQPPVGPLPWLEETSRKMWFEVAGGGVVELPPESVMYSVQATYHRSHCWMSAKIWEEALTYGIGGGILPPSALLDTDPASGEGPGPSAEEALAFPTPNDPGAPASPFVFPSTAGSSPLSLALHTEGNSPILSSPQYAIRSRNQSPIPRGRIPSRVNHTYRSSIALGIEPLALPEGAYPAIGRRHASTSRDMPPRQELSTTDRGVRRSVSHGNLEQLMSSHSPPRGGPPLAHAKNPSTLSYDPPIDSADKTFDSILGKVEKKPRKSKRWVLF